MAYVAITGGARGIGAATARAFAAKGHPVAIGDIDAELATKTAAEISADSGTAVIGLPLDVTGRESFTGFLDTAESELGGLDVLVNNAGIMPTGLLLDEPDGVTDRQLDINVRGVILGSKLGGRRFAERGRGHLVNIASVAGHAAAPGVAVYCAGKHAVVGLDIALRQELKPHGVRVSTICPGFVNTELISGLSPNWLIRQIAYVQPEDVAAAIVRVVERGKGGIRFVPRIAGGNLKLLSLLRENTRNGVLRLLGLHDVTLHSDEPVRGAYRARTENLDLDSVRGRDQRQAS
ncbi:MAG: SDR family oxidoreductase [Micromonosporaceae bacterium]